MRPYPIIPNAVFLLALVPFGLGCANHIRFAESVTEHSLQAVVEREVGVGGGEAIVEQPVVALDVFEQRVVETRTSRIVTRSEVLTPYAGSRETFEVPAGIVSLPVSLAFNLIGIWPFGSIPDDLVQGYTDWTFAALNPALNTESEARSETRVVEEKREDAGSKRETVRSALSGARIRFSLDDGPPRTVVADANGRVRLRLIDLVGDDLRLPPRRLHVELAPGPAPTPATASISRAGGSGANRSAAIGSAATAGEAEPAKRPRLSEGLELDRRLARRLFRAAPVLASVRAPDATPEVLSRALRALEELGFRQRAAELEDEIFARLAGDAAALAALQAALDAPDLQPGSARPVVPASASAP